jgi:cation diffusion facilitator CzcD-associated flavoprotein CzcO
VTCRYVVTANGPLSSPRMPEFPGMERFKGESFHTAQWKRDASLRGKRVGVVGTGASAAQVITAIADDVATLHVFQRTATWCLRRDDQPTPPEMQEKFRAGGFGEALRYIDWKGERPAPETPFTFEMLHDPVQNAVICGYLKGIIRQDVPDRQLAKRLTPDYPFFCKRPLFIDDYYTTFNKSHVTLVDDAGGVVGVNETGLTIARGEHYELDVIIYATGFDGGFMPFPILGRNGVSLSETFGASAASNFQPTRARTLWGIHVDEMPNLFMMIGPQSLNPVTNVTLLCEQQSIYIRDLILKMKAAGKSHVEPSKQAVDGWTARCDASAEGKVWLRCNNYYTKFTKTDEAAGRDRAAGMWMASFHEYLQHLLGAQGGTPDELLEFS